LFVKKKKKKEKKRSLTYRVMQEWHHFLGQLAEKNKKNIGFWIVAKNKLCDQQKFMILASFVHQDNYHKWTHNFSKFEVYMQSPEVKSYKQTT